jgi:glutathione S-transferase
MKIQGPSSLQNRPAQSLKKGKTGDAFQTLLETEIDASQSITSPGQHKDRQQTSRQQWQLVEEAALLLDQALEQLAAGEKPAEEVLTSIQRLRTQLHQHAGEAGDELTQADAMLAVEAERIHSLNH